MRGCAVSKRYINVYNSDVFSVVNVYLDNLKFCSVCIDGRRYICCSEYYVVRLFKTIQHCVRVLLNTETILKGIPLHTRTHTYVRVHLIQEHTHTHTPTHTHTHPYTHIYNIYILHIIFKIYYYLLYMYFNFKTYII